MPKNTRKLLVITLIFIFGLIVFSSAKPVFAQYNLTPGSCDLSSLDHPEPWQILCPILRLLNFVIIVAGIVFAVMITYGAIKISTSLGDPKAYAGAWRNMWFAILGVFVVLGAYAILRILSSVFGLNINFLGTGPHGILNSVNNKFIDTLVQLGIIQIN